MKNYKGHQTGHPWSDFLLVRMDVIKWMREEWPDRDDADIAKALSMDTDQVELVCPSGDPEKNLAAVRRSKAKE